MFAELPWTEIFGAATGLLCVYWVTKQNVWSWPVGIVNNAFLFVVFWTGKLYADATLQVIFAGLGFYGWYSWVYGKKDREKLPVRKTSRLEAGIFLVVAIAGTLGTSEILSRTTDSPLPFWDALITVLSLIASYGQARKLLESWWIWICVDLISVPVYLSRELYPTAGLYVVFGALCVLGLRNWRRDLT